MTLRDQLLSIAEIHAEAAGISRAWLSTKLFNDGKRLDVIAAGRDLNTRTFERAMEWFSQNWPEGAQWPEGVARPGGEDARPGEGAAETIAG